MKAKLLIWLILLTGINRIYCQDLRRTKEYNPDFIQYMELIKSGKDIPIVSESGMPLGEIPVPVLPNFDEFYKNNKNKPSKDFPPVYDLRDLNLVTPVRNQFSCGACWAFATFGSIESHWKKLGITAYDLSEDNLNNCHNFDYLPCKGGQAYMSSAYLARSAGPVSEAVDPYNGSGSSGVCPEDLKPLAYVFDSRFLPKDAGIIKQTIMDWGALYTNFRWEDEYYNQSNYSYFYQGPPDSATNHAVTLVGWNDTLETAGGIGAWIIKNSWGTSWSNNVPSDEGYFFISYNDPKVNSLVAYFPYRNTNNFNGEIYGYDELGRINDIGFDSPVAYALIKLSSPRNEQVTKIIICTNTCNTILDIEIFDNFDGFALSNYLGGLSNELCDFPGYHSFDLPMPVSRNQYDDYYIKVKYSAPGASFPIAVEQSIENYSSNAVIETGVCWISPNGNTWNAIGTGTANENDLCIKAYAVVENHLSQLEYFFDVDPGMGNGIPVSINNSANIDINLNIPLDEVSAGFHVLYFRAKDENGKWGLSDNQPFYRYLYNPASNLVKFEYFFDNDPGLGNGIAVTTNPESNVVKSFNIPLNSINTGMHTLYIRAFDNVGNWSLCHSSAFYRLTTNEIFDITAIEYFFDTDPGFGEGTLVNVTLGTNIVKDFNIDLSGNEPGFHTLYLRTKDAYGKWGLCEVRPFYNTGYHDMPEITGLEYYFDNDPGLGDGIQVPVTQGTFAEKTFFVDITGLPAGMHSFCLRAKDTEGNWSLVNWDKFYLLDLKVFLEGSYYSANGQMNSQLNSIGVLPLGQPYNSNTGADWYYSGIESVTSIPNNDIVDWVLVQIRDAAAPNQANNSTIKKTTPGFLMKDGQIKSLTGSDLFLFMEDITQNLYAVVYHRNHLGIMSASGIPQTGTGAGIWDFTSGSNKVYGGTTGYKLLGGNVWGLMSGDGDGNGVINSTDKTSIWKLQSGMRGYKPGDYDMNSQVNNPDKNNYWLPNNGKSSQIP